jgi:AraC-like DNA-binding protein
MLSYLHSESFNLGEGERKDVGGGRSGTFGFVLKENVQCLAEDEAAVFEAATEEWFYISPNRGFSVRNPEVGIAEVLLIRFEEFGALALGEQGPSSCRLPHSRMWVEAFMAACDIPFAALPDVLRLTLQSHLYALAAAWLLRTKENEADGTEALLMLMERTHRLMANRFNESWNLEEIARESGVTVSRFYQAFKEYTGFTPHKWLTAARLNASLSLLSNSPASIMDVAHSVGYADELYFSRVFKKHMGLSPTEYVVRANRRIANLCTVFQGDFMALGITPAFAPPRGWTARWQELLQSLEIAQPDIIYTHPVSEEILAGLRRIAPVEMITWKNSNLTWKERLLRIGQSLELASVAERWLVLFRMKAANARRLVRLVLGETPFLIVAVHLSGYRVYGRQAKKMSDLFYEALSLTPPATVQKIRLLETDRLEEISELCENALLLIPDTFTEWEESKLVAEWNILHPKRAKCLIIRHPAPSLYNASFYGRLVDETVSRLMGSDK